MNHSKPYHKCNIFGNCLGHHDGGHLQNQVALIYVRKLQNLASLQLPRPRIICPKQMNLPSALRRARVHWLMSPASLAWPCIWLTLPSATAPALLMAVTCKYVHTANCNLGTDTCKWLYHSIGSNLQPNPYHWSICRCNVVK